MSKLLLIVLGAFLVLATINFISALPCHGSCIPDEPVETDERVVRAVVGNQCPIGQVLLRGKCRTVAGVSDRILEN
jgi:hypothetical protein